MKFGLFYELQLPRPWQPDDEYKLYKNTLDQIELADRSASTASGRSSTTSSRSTATAPRPRCCSPPPASAPKRIRLGHGIVQLPNEINPTARVAERIAALDLLSDGRVEFGTGEGSSVAELLRVRRRLGLQARRSGPSNLDAVTRMMVEEPFAGWESKWLTVPPRNVVPKPLQKPHPPLWVACSQPSTIQLAASKGIGASVVRLPRPERKRRRSSTATTSTITSGDVRAGGLRRQRQRRDRVAVDVSLRRADRARARLAGLDVLRLRARSLLRVRHAASGRHRHLERVRQQQVDRVRRHRLASWRSQDLGDTKSTEKAGEDLLRGAIGTRRRGSARCSGATRPPASTRSSSWHKRAAPNTSTSASRSSCSPRGDARVRRPRAGARKGQERTHRRGATSGDGQEGAAAHRRSELLLRRRRSAVASQPNVSPVSV